MRSSTGRLHGGRGAARHVHMNIEEHDPVAGDQPVPGSPRDFHACGCDRGALVRTDPVAAHRRCAARHRIRGRRRDRIIHIENQAIARAAANLAPRCATQDAIANRGAALLKSVFATAILLPPSGGRVRERGVKHASR